MSSKVKESPRYRDFDTINRIHNRLMLFSSFESSDDLKSYLSSLIHARSSLSSASSPLPLLKPLTQSNVPKEVQVHDRFAISATPDYFITGCYAVGKSSSIRGIDCNDVIQHLEYRSANGDGSRDRLPKYIFQLGGLMLPGNNVLMEERLPFVVVLDILDSSLPVWLVHDRDVEEDPEEDKPWRPSLLSLTELAPLFGDLKSSRQPVYHIAQLAPNLFSWSTMSWDDILSNISRTRSRVTVKIREVEDVFQVLVKENEARKERMEPVDDIKVSYKQVHQKKAPRHH